MPFPSISLHNSLTNQKETFTPINDGSVQIYACGPTVYDFAHIGNFRTFLMSDLLCRTLKMAGYTVTKVMNITDVGHLTGDDLADADGEDKISKKALREKKDPFEVAKMFEDIFIEDEQKLLIQPPDHRPRATDYISEQLDLCKELMEKGFAYKVNGSVYFRTRKFPAYGKLSNNKLEDLDAGNRVEINTEKEDPLDFALWKGADENHLMQWDFETGEQLKVKSETWESVAQDMRGFPGWHIECSAMSKKLLGEHFDIHTGGEDNMFPHHECEIAQNEASCGHQSVNYWLHGKHLLVDGKKMSKSTGNFYTVRDLFEKGYEGRVIRFALMSAHYRSALNFTTKSLDQAQSSIKRIEEARDIFSNYKGTQETTDWVAAFVTRFQMALYDDLNTADALGAVFELISEGMKQRDSESLATQSASQIVEFLNGEFNAIFEALEDSESIPPEVQSLLDKRAQARADRDWAASDSIREEIQLMGYEVLDEAGGQRVRSI